MRHRTPWHAILAGLDKEGWDRRTVESLATRICDILIAGLEEEDNNIIFVLKDELTWGKIHEKENTP
jgi:uncharacterized Ntn-hydrolase superfamily protein